MLNVVQVNGVQYTHPMTDARRSPPLRHDRESVVDAAIEILDRHGLGDLTMRRLGAALEVQPSALYWHFENKQALLAAVAERIVAGAPHDARDTDQDADWRDRTRAAARGLRDGLLSSRDGAEVVLSTLALGLGSDLAQQRLAAALSEGLPHGDAESAATVLLQFVLGHTSLVQQRLQADSLGALASGTASPALVPDESFELGVELVLAGLAQRGAKGGFDTPSLRSGTQPPGGVKPR